MMGAAATSLSTLLQTVIDISPPASSLDAYKRQLVGKEVYLKTTTSSGETKLVQGRVDYVSYENNKAYLYINEKKSSSYDLDSIVDANYLDAYNKAYNFTAVSYTHLGSHIENPMTD